MACRIEDAGFEIRDLIAWVYGSGFPKSLDVSKALDKAAGHWRGQAGAAMGDNGSMSGCNYERTAKGEPVTAAAAAGWGTALKPSMEPITLARKPLIGTVAENWCAHGTGALNIDGCRVIGSEDCARAPALVNDTAAPFGKGLAMGGNGSDLGRWPANLIHDGSDEVVALFPAETGASPTGRIARGERAADNIYGGQPNAAGTFGFGFGDSGSAARFFYCPKADRADRNDGCGGMESRRFGMSGGAAAAAARGEDYDNGDSGINRTTMRQNYHPTVKPTDLMRYLCRLITPPGGTVLDPFMGSGSTGRGAISEGFRFIGIELDPEYARIAEARIRAVQPGMSFAGAA